jgi:hypothetical protein
MDDALKLLISSLTDPFAIAATVFLLASVLYFTRVIITKANPQELAAWERRLREPRGAVLYQTWLTAILDWLHRRLMPKDADPQSVERPWGWPLLDLCLRFAVAYPILMLVLGWALFGIEGRVGSLVLLPEDTVWWARLVAIGGLVSVLVGRFTANSLPSRKRVVVQFVAYGLAVAFAGVAAFAGAGVFTDATTSAIMAEGAAGLAFGDSRIVAAAVADIFADADEVANAVAASVAVAGAGAVAFAFAVAGTGAGAVAVAVAASVTVAVAGTGAGAGAGAGEVVDPVAVADKVAVAGAVAGTSAVAVAVAVAVERATRRGHGAAAHGCFIILMITILIATARNGDMDFGPVRISLVFLGVLPLFNAVFDYASIGLTRYLLRRGLATPRAAWAWGITDLVAAIAAFILLGCALIAMIHLMNGAANPPVLDLPALFSDLHDPVRRGDYGWLYLMLFSTFVPTFLHFSISLWSVMALPPRAVRVWVADRFALFQTSTAAEWSAVAALGIMATVIIAGPVLAVLFILTRLWDAYPWIGDGFLCVFENFAWVIGVAVTPGCW